MYENVLIVKEFIGYAEQSEKTGGSYGRCKH